MDPKDTLDGRTFEPWWGQTATRRVPRPVFSEQDRQRLAADPHVRPYLAITQTEVAGLLYALGRGAGLLYPYDPRLLDNESDIQFVDAEALEASQALDRVYHDLRYEDRRRPAPPPKPDAVFDAAEQHELSYRKNIWGMERITREELVRLLRAVDRYTTRAPYMDVFPDRSGVATSRWLHAHNVLVGFRERPMTLEEFSEQVTFVMREALRRGE
jgi:hypothetical protein